MIKFNIDSIRATSDRYAELTRSADRQHSEVDGMYRSIKSAVLEKIRCVERDIATAESELQQVQAARAHNQEIERRERERIRVAKEKKEKLEKDKKKAENSLGSARRKLGLVRLMDQDSGSVASQLESKISSLESEISSLESDIKTQQDIIDAAEKKLEEVERANRRLDQIETAIRRSIQQMKLVLSKLKQVKEQMVRHKEIYDGKYGMTKRGMQAVHERTAKAFKAACDALSQFSAAGCGSSKSVEVDSPTVIANLSYEISYGATHLSSHAFEMKNEADRYGSRLRDRISAEAIKKSKEANALCERMKGEWEQVSLSLKNASYLLDFYLECKM